MRRAAFVLLGVALLGVRPLYASEMEKTDDLRSRPVQRCAPGVYADDCDYYDNSKRAARALPERVGPLRPCHSHELIRSDYGTFCDERESREL